MERAWRDLPARGADLGALALLDTRRPFVSAQPARQLLSHSSAVLASRLPFLDQVRTKAQCAPLLVGRQARGRAASRTLRTASHEPAVGAYLANGHSHPLVDLASSSDPVRRSLDRRNHLVLAAEERTGRASSLNGRDGATALAELTGVRPVSTSRPSGAGRRAERLGRFPSSRPAFRLSLTLVTG